MYFIELLIIIIDKFIFRNVDKYNRYPNRSKNNYITHLLFFFKAKS